MGETKPVASRISSLKSESSQYQNQFVEIWYNKDSDARKKPTIFLGDWFVKTPKEPIAILMQQTEPEKSETIEFEYGDESKFIALFETFGFSGFRCKDENRHVFNLSVC